MEVRKEDFSKEVLENKDFAVFLIMNYHTVMMACLTVWLLQLQKKEMWLPTARSNFSFFDESIDEVRNLLFLNYLYY